MTRGIRERTRSDGRTVYDVRVDLPPDPKTGARRRRSQTFTDKSKAQERRLEWLLELRRDTVIDPTRMTMTDLLHRWLDDDAAPRVRATTLDDYRHTIEKHLVPRLGTIKARDLTPADVHRCIAQMGRETGARTTQLALLRLKATLSWAVSIEILKRNVAAGVKAPKGNPKQMRALSHSEAQDFLRIAATDTYWPLWLVFLSTGLRLGEGLGLRWRDLDLDRGLLSVRQQVGLVKGEDGRERPTVTEVKTAASRRTIDLDHNTVEALDRHLVAVDDQKARVVQIEERDHVFCTRHGTLLNANNVYRNFKAIRNDCGLGPDVTVHTLRHTHASHLLAAGVPILEVSKRLGHAKTSVTLDLYGHLLSDRSDTMLDAIERALFPHLPELGGSANASPI